MPASQALVGRFEGLEILQAVSLVLPCAGWGSLSQEGGGLAEGAVLLWGTFVGPDVTWGEELRGGSLQICCRALPHLMAVEGPHQKVILT